MRRMLPQKLIDWIKSLKDKLYVKNNQVVIDDNPVITGKDVSDKVTPHTDLTITIKSAQKLSNGFVILSLRAANETASSIAADTALATLSEEIRPSNYLRIPCFFSSTSTSVVIGSDGTIKSGTALAATAVLNLYCIYPLGE